MCAAPKPAVISVKTESSDCPALFTPITFRSIRLKNRIGVSPMCQYSAQDGKVQDGMMNDWHLVHLGSRAVGGAGLIIAEATAVRPEGRISPQDAGLWSDDHIAPMKRITQFLKEQECVPGIQLAHAGRKGSAARPWEGAHHLKDSQGGWPTLAPSALVFDPKKLNKMPNVLSIEEIEAIQAAFVAATQRAVEAGFQWLELHAAHGYLAHSFYSPLTNHRDDRYGGSFENRCRFVLETATVMRKAWPSELPMSVRLSCSDWAQEGQTGWDLAQSIQLSVLLKAAGVDLIDCSSGFATPGVGHYPIEPNWQVPFSEAIKKEAGIATAAVGMITEPEQANDIITEGKADIVLLAREMLRDPYWPWWASKTLGYQDALILPPQYSHWVEQTH